MTDVKLETTAIVPIEIFTEERKGTEILIVKDGNQEIYSTAKEYIINTVTNRRERYLERPWRIAYKSHEEGYNDFYSFLFPLPESNNKDLEKRVERLEEKIQEVLKQKKEVETE